MTLLRTYVYVYIYMRYFIIYDYFMHVCIQCMHLSKHMAACWSPTYVAERLPSYLNAACIWSKSCCSGNAATHEKPNHRYKFCDQTNSVLPTLCI